MNKLIIIFVLLVVVFVSGCVEYPDISQGPQSSSPREEVGGEVELPPVERADWVLLECMRKASRRYGNCIRSCAGLPEYEHAQCMMVCQNNYDFDMARCISEKYSEI